MRKPLIGSQTALDAGEPPFSDFHPIINGDDMAKVLGPRLVAAINASGEEVIFSIEFQYESPKVLDFHSGEKAYSYRGSVEISTSTEHQSIPQEAIDELQLTACLMKLAYAWIGRVCEDEGLQLYKSVPGDIQGPFDLFT